MPFDYSQMTRYAGEGGGVAPNPVTPQRPQIQIGGGQADVDRSRMMGQQMAGRTAYQPNVNDANSTREGGVTASKLMYGAATGAAPSRAELLGHQMIGQSLDAQMAGAAAAKGGPMGQMAAQRGVQQGAAAFQQNGANNIEAMRAQEMADARSQFGNQMNTMRGQDLAQQGILSQNEQFQRGLNQQGQLAMEGQGAQQNIAQANVDLGQQQDDSANWRGERQNQEQHWANQMATNAHTVDRNTGLLANVLGGVANGVGGAIGGLLQSDVRVKKDVHPLDQPMGKHESWMPHHQQPAFEAESYDELPHYRSDVDRIRYGMPDERSEVMLDDRAAQHENAPTRGVPEWLEHAPPPAPHARIWTGQEINDDEYDSRPMSKSEWLSRMPDDKFRRVFGRHKDAPSMGELAEEGRSADDGAAPSKSRLERGIGHGLASSGKGFSDYGTALMSQPLRLVSDPISKRLLQPMSGPAQATFAGAGGMQGGSPMGELKAQSDFATQFQRNPTGPMLTSDPDAKSGISMLDDAIWSGRKAVWHVMGHEMTDDDVRKHSPYMKHQIGKDPDSRPLLTSDPRAKRDAFDMGVEHALTKFADAATSDQGLALQAGPLAPHLIHAVEDAFPRDREMKSFSHTGRPQEPSAFTPDMSDDDVRRASEQWQHEQGGREAPFARPAGDFPSLADVGRRVAGASARGALEGARAAPPAQMMDAIGSGKAFKYQPGVGEDPNKQHFGTTTEDLKKTPMGASVVVPGGANGFDAIDVKEAVGPTFSALGNLNQRLRELEMQGRRARGGH